MKFLQFALAGVAITPLFLSAAEAAPKHHHAKHAVKADISAQVKELQASNLELRAKLDALTAQLQLTSEKTDSVASRSDAAVARAAEAEQLAKTAEVQIDTLPTKVADAVAAERSKNDKIYYKGISLTLGGYLDLNAIYRSRTELADNSSSWSGIPFANKATYNQDETRFSARGTRFSVLAKGDASKDVHLTGYIEADFLGAARTANNNLSDSYNPRIRQGFLSVDWDTYGLNLTAGQGWSLATLYAKGLRPLNESIPITIDQSFLPGFVYTRQSEVRLVKDLPYGFTAAVAVENPATIVGGTAPKKDALGNVLTPASGSNISTSQPGGSGYDVDNNYTYHSLPDVIGKLAYDVSFYGRNVHLEGYGLYRQFVDDVTLGTTATGTASTTQHVTKNRSDGGGLGLGLYANAIPKVLDVTVSVTSGAGIGRYGVAQNPDVTYAEDGSLKPLRDTALLVGGIWHLDPAWDVFAYGGSDTVTRSYGTDNGGNFFGYGNPNYDNRACFQYQVPLSGSTTCIANLKSSSQGVLGFWHKIYVGNFGKLQYGLTYSYTKDKAFRGNGGAPHTDDSIVMTSLRYYPF